MAPGRWVRSPLPTPKDLMDLSVYTNAVEEPLRQTLSQLYHIATYAEGVSCSLAAPATSSYSFFEVSIRRILARDQEESYKWAKGVYDRLRLFPMHSGLTVSFIQSKSYWTKEHYGYSNLGLVRWRELKSYCGGLTATIAGTLTRNLAFSNEVSAKLTWTFKAPEGMKE